MDKKKLNRILKERYMIENAELEFLRECGGQVYIVNSEKYQLFWLRNRMEANGIS